MVEAQSANTPSGFSDIFGDDLFGMFPSPSSRFSFELPSTLVEHDDGYYPEGYTLGDVPVSVVVSANADQNGNSDKDSNRARLEEAMSAADGQGYATFSVVIGQKSATLITHWGKDAEDSELLYYDGLPTAVEVYIKGSDDYEVTPEAVLALVLGSIGKDGSTQKVTDNWWGDEFR